MWVVSALVIAIVGYVVGGRELPVEIVDQLKNYVPEDFAPGSRNLALSFIVGMVIAGTPLHTLLRYLSTVVHELGHAFTAGLLGGRPKSITISLDSSGLAVYHPPGDWGRFRASLVSLAGYPAPAIASLAAVNAVQSGHPKAWFAFAAGTLAISVPLLVRNFWGFLFTGGVAAASYYGARELTVEIIALIVGGVAGYLAVEAYRNARTQLTLIKRSPGIGVDAERVAMWWRMSPRFVGTLHLWSVLGISGWSSYLAVNPYWSEISTWVTDVIQTQ